LVHLSDLAAASDEDLFSQIRRKEYPAFVTLFDRYRQRVVSYAGRMTGDPDEAENLAHDAFLKMVEEAPRMEPGRPFKPLLFKFVRALVYDHVAKNRPEAKASLERLESIGAPPAASGDARQAYAVLNKLGPVYREVLYLRVFEGMTHEQIGEVTGEKPAAVKTRLNYAVEHLRKEIR
jgi:RNA polymerase sigma-70 factor (ECF subfamily)